MVLKSIEQPLKLKNTHTVNSTNLLDRHLCTTTSQPYKIVYIHETNYKISIFLLEAPSTYSIIL